MLIFTFISLFLSAIACASSEDDYGFFQDIQNYKRPTTNYCLHEQRDVYLENYAFNIKKNRMVLDVLVRKRIAVSADQYADLQLELDVAMSVALIHDDTKDSMLKTVHKHHDICCLHAAGFKTSHVSMVERFVCGSRIACMRTEARAATLVQLLKTSVQQDPAPTKEKLD